MSELTQEQSLEAAASLSDTPHTCIARHALITGRGRAWKDRGSIIIHPHATPGELLGFGNDVDALVTLLRQISTNWRCIEVAPQIADALSSEMTSALGVTIDRVDDLYFTLPDDVALPAVENVRLLTAADADRYAGSGASYCESSDAARLNVIEGPVVAALVDDRIVAATEANVRTEKYANFSVRTTPEFQRRGLATATAIEAARIVRAMNLIPLWSCAATNTASQRIAQNLGFARIEHCVYLIPRFTSLGTG